MYDWWMLNDFYYKDIVLNVRGGVRLLDFVRAFVVLVANSCFLKEEHLIDYPLIWRGDRGRWEDCMVIPSKNLTTQYRLLVMDLKIKRTKKKKVRNEQSRIKWGNLTMTNAQEMLVRHRGGCGSYMPIIYSLALLIPELHQCIKIEASPAEHHLNMPKDTSVNSFSVNQSRTSPYSCSSENSDLDSKKSLPSVVNEREWEEAKCPICLEHPHNAVLLLCSSRDKGCQPYMCDTSHRHSNCFDQFRKSSAVGAQQGEGNVSGAVFRGESWGQTLSGASRSHVQKQPDLTCPLCRGHVEGWIVVKAARNFMNSKTRSCALEACNFSGNYAELRNHARQEHPLERPSEVDPMRQSNWTRLGLQREFEDANAYQTHFEDANAYQTHSVDDFLADLPLDLPLDTGLFDLLDMSLHWCLRYGIGLQAMLVGGAPIDQRVVLDHKTGDLEDRHQILITMNKGQQVQETQICCQGTEIGRAFSVWSAILIAGMGTVQVTLLLHDNFPALLG
ncbi:hypothetical protein H5410_062356 [Solanum commersonii]|uniref:Uncharacterized protein n=1 Tax=Solanum commersonii TaxID=4109 RepID=A0A9J5WCE5_SOLCO|nr:hypothetical protein H5410_062356 [Solanum commersonii]